MMGCPSLFRLKDHTHIMYINPTIWVTVAQLACNPVNVINVFHRRVVLSCQTKCYSGAEISQNNMK